MLENVKYNLGREYEYYATISLGQRSKGKAAVAIKKEVAHTNTHNPWLKEKSYWAASLGDGETLRWLGFPQ